MNFKLSTSKVILLLLPLAFLLNSCSLKDSFSIESYEDFAYITNIDGKKCAATSNWYITSELIQGLEYGDCYILSYRITDQSAANVYTASYTEMVSDGALRRFVLSEQESITPSDLSDYEPFDVAAAGVNAYDPTTYYGDNWHFKVSSQYSFNNNDVRPRFYYDKNNQFDESGSDVTGRNRVIIDIVFEAKEGVSKENNNKVYDFVVNMSPLRTLFSPNLDGAQTSGSDKYVNVLVMFRYKKEGKDVFLGSWDGYYSSFMRFIIANES